MWRTGMCSFGFGNWIFILTAVHLFTFIQGVDESKLDEGVRFTIEPRDVVVPRGAATLLACAASSRGTVRLSWRHSETAAPTRDHSISPQDKYRKVLLNGSLLIENMSKSVSGQYQCVASVDGVGTIVSKEATVFLAEVPAVVPVSRSVLGVAGGPVLLPCGISAPARLAWRLASAPPERRLLAKTATHVPPQLVLNVTWLKNGSPVVLEPARVSVLWSGALELEPARPHDAAAYSCRVALQHAPDQHVVGDAIELRINSELENVEYAPRFIATPQPVTVMEGASITLDCAAVGNPKPEIVWLINGAAIDLSDLDSRLSRVGAGSLGVAGARAGDAGRYTCRAAGPRDSAEHSATLAVRSPPRVHVWRGGSRGAVQHAVARGELVLRCESRSRPAPALAWLKDGEPLTPNNHDLVIVDNGSSLRIQGVLSVDAGMWQCAARSPTGLALAAVRLIVQSEESEAEINNTTKSSSKIPIKPTKKPKATSPLPKHVYAKTFLNSLKTESDTSSTYTNTPVKSSNSTQDIFNSLVSSESFTEDETLDPEPESLDFLGETSSAYTPSPEYEYDDTPDSDLNLQTTFHAAKGLDVNELANQNSSIVSKPKDFKAVIVKHRFVTLSWEAPEQALEDIKGYAVIFKVKGSERERVSTGDAHKHEMNVASLQPNTTYTFQVYAYSQHGATPSDIIEVLTPVEELVFGSVRSVHVETGGPHGAKVTWQPPLGTTAPDKYTLTYMEVESGREQYVSVDADPLSEIVSTTLSGLRAATEYVISVRAAGGAGSGAGSGVASYTTPSDVPAAPPGNVTAVATSATTIVVTWSAPPARSLRGALTGYKVRYRARSTGDRKQHFTITTPADTTRAELTQLDINTTYQIRVCAINANGSGPFSDWSAAATRPAARAPAAAPPAPPPALHTRAGRDWVSVWWAEEDGGGERGGERGGLLLGWGLGVPDEHSRRLAPAAHSALVQGLEPNSEYVVSLRASNAVGLGPAVYATVRTRPAALDGDEVDDDDEQYDEDDDEPQPLLPPVGLKVIMLSGTTAVVYWTDPTLPKGQTATDGRRYVVRWAAAGGGGGGAGGRPRVFNASDLNCMLDDLRPHTTYDFSVKLIKGGRESAWSMIVSNTTLESAPASPPRDLRPAPYASPTPSPRAVELTWAPPSKPNGVITGYVVMYAVAGGEEWSAVAVGGGGGMAERARIDRLRPRTTYLFKVQARNSRGLGPFCAPVQYTTGLEEGRGGGLAAATSAWLWASAGGACAVLALAAALALSLCCRRAAEPRRDNTSTYQKSSASAGIKPPDLWIHHDQMELKHMDKSIHSSASKISAGSMEGNLVSSTLTLGRPPPPADYERGGVGGVGVGGPPTLERQYVPTYVDAPRSESAAGSDDTRAASSTHSAHCYTHYSMTGAGTCERRHVLRAPLHNNMADQYCDVMLLGSPQSSLASLHPPPAPCGSGTCPLGSACSAPAVGGGGAVVGGGGDIYACAARERGQYVAYEPLGTYTHRESVSSEAGGSVSGGPGGVPGGVGGAAGAAGGGGSLQRRPCVNTSLLHSFTDNCSPTHTIGSVRDTSPYKKSANSSPGHIPNRLQLGPPLPHCPSELEPLTPSRSTERLHREMQNLEGLMKDLSAITHHHC